MAVGPIGHGYLAFKLNALSTLSPEEETHDERPQSKAKYEVKGYFLSLMEISEENRSTKINAAHLHQQMNLSKGYAGNLLMPPDLN